MRMKKQKTEFGEEQIVEEFSLYRPIVMANITGIDNITGDRCIKIILEKSINERKTRLLENTLETKITTLKKKLHCFYALNVVSVDVVISTNIKKAWNNFILQETALNYISTLTTLTTLTTLKKRFEKIKESGINGRDLELAFPLLLTSMLIDNENTNLFSETFKTLLELFEQKKEDEFTENWDISLIDFLSQELEVSYFVSIIELTNKFRDFTQLNDKRIIEEMRKIVMIE